MEKSHYSGREIKTKYKKDELIKWFKLSQVPGLGPQKIKKLLSYFKNIGAIFEAKDLDLLQTRVFNNEMINEFSKLKSASDENFANIVDTCKAGGINILTLNDETYPEKLSLVQSPPLSLFMIGRAELLFGKKVAVVGTREPSEEAKKYTYDLSKYLAEQDVIIVSGGAIGIDTEAHKGALSTETGKTICVLGSGFNYVYPPENTALFEEVKKRGLLVSEHLPNFRGSKISYLQRNRITSGLSDALFLVAATEKGGAMTQVNIADMQKKPIFCPKLSLNLKPNEGVIEAVQKYHAIQIETPVQFFKQLNNSLSSFL